MVEVPTFLYPGFGLSGCKAIESLHISLNLSARILTDRALSNSWAHAIQIIKSVVDAAHMTLSTITVAIHSAFFDVDIQRRFGDRIDPEHWARLEEHLKPLGLELLTKVTVRLGPVGGRAGPLSARAIRSLPRIHARGILKIC